MPAQRVNTICMQVKINLLFQRKIAVDDTSTHFHLHFGLKVKLSKDFHPSHSSYYPIHRETISVELSILYFKGLLLKISMKLYFCP